MQTQETHIAAITETKLEGPPPYIPGYKWIHKNRKNHPGGGVAFILREDIANQIYEIKELEDNNQEILWIQIKNKNNKTFLGVFYGLQEKASREEINRQYSQITTQIIKLKKRRKHNSNGRL